MYIRRFSRLGYSRLEPSKFEIDRAPYSKREGFQKFINPCSQKSIGYRPLGAHPGGFDV